MKGYTIYSILLVVLYGVSGMFAEARIGCFRFTMRKVALPLCARYATTLTAASKLYLANGAALYWSIGYTRRHFSLAFLKRVFEVLRLKKNIAFNHKKYQLLVILYIYLYLTFNRSETEEQSAKKLLLPNF